MKGACQMDEIKLFRTVFTTVFIDSGSLIAPYGHVERFKTKFTVPQISNSMEPLLLL